MDACALGSVIAEGAMMICSDAVVARSRRL
jgi:hypothetical protein